MGQELSAAAQGSGGGPPAGEKADRRELLMALQKESGFAHEQVEGLYEHFRRIATLREDDGVVSKDEFLDVLQAKPSVLLDRMFALFDHDGSGTIDFREFLVGLAILCDRSSREEKLKFCFRMYDLDGDGFITRDELLKIVESCLFQNALVLPKDVLSRVVEATFSKADADGDGRITEQEFESYVIRNPQVIEQLTIQSETLRSLKQGLRAEGA
eukprot:TRINITY_DN34971_c0_g1_i1.p1 TRINITY_DN34971_c0_g1~~TRINITY_DN34971_c0_g1_i1.p1  ORF type:complete len:214 (-),score=53.66 TRINITY_DN34971_c0_g1_i1:788-1429(-)